MHPVCQSHLSPVRPNTKDGVLKALQSLISFTFFNFMSRGGSFLSLEGLIFLDHPKTLLLIFAVSLKLRLRYFTEGSMNMSKVKPNR